MKWKFLLPLCLLGFTLLSSEEPESIFLEPLWHVGETFNVKETTTGHVKMVSNGKERLSDIRECIEYTMDVLEIDPTDHLVVRITINDFFHQSKDSNEMPPSLWKKMGNYLWGDSQTRPWKKVRNFVSGKSFEVKCNFAGDVIQISGHAEWVAELNAMIDEDPFSFYTLTSEKNLGDLIAEQVSFFPTQSIALGKTWTKMLPMGEKTLPLDAMKTPVTFTLSSLNGDSLEIQVAYEIPLQISEEDLKGKGEVRAKGKIVLDRSTGNSSSTLTQVCRGVLKDSTEELSAELQLVTQTEFRKL